MKETALQVAEKIASSGFFSRCTTIHYVQNGVDFGEKSHLFKIREKLWH